MVSTSRAFPKFESYGMLETAASVGWKVKDAIVGFHGIGRLEAASVEKQLRKPRAGLLCTLSNATEEILQFPILIPRWTTPK